MSKLIPFETGIPVIAKENGYNEKGTAYYSLTDKNLYYIFQDEGEDFMGRSSNEYTGLAIIAPSYQDIVDWLRINYDISIEMSRQENGIYTSNIDNHGELLEVYTGEYYKGLEEAIKQSFKLLK